VPQTRYHSTIDEITLLSISSLEPYWVTGFTDAEGCFTIIIEILGESPLKFKVRASYEISLHSVDSAILYRIQSFFNTGKIYKRSDQNISVYRVTNVKELLTKVIPHFNAYPLLSKKQADFILWSRVVDIMHSKDHLTLDGLLRILP